MQQEDIHQCIIILREEISKYKIPVLTLYAQNERNPFHILISTVLSLRTKDKATFEASERLLSKADTPFEMIKLTNKEIEELIYPVGFYRVKAENILSISHALINKYKGNVPDDIDLLLKLKGVGRKTANLVLSHGFKKAAICVDIHVHRISNRWAYVKTKTPEETEIVLRKILPKEYWLEINDLLVTYGQNLCLPVSPKCSLCRLSNFCEKVNVEKSR